MNLAELMQKADTMTTKPEPKKAVEVEEVETEPQTKETSQEETKPQEQEETPAEDKKQPRQMDPEKAKKLLAQFEPLKQLGLTVELIGFWFWVSGDTKPHKETIKAVEIEGYKCGFSKSKQLWYFSPVGYRKRSKKQWTKDEIDEKFEKVQL